MFVCFKSLLCFSHLIYFIILVSSYIILLLSIKYFYCLNPKSYVYLRKYSIIIIRRDGNIVGERYKFFQYM